MKNVVKLSQRLTAIADMTVGGGCLCDVGTDHAHIPIRLLQEERIRSAIAMDVISGPLAKAQENLSLYGCTQKVSLRLSDGLDAYHTGEAQSLVIAGMGGRIMGRILLREPDKTLDFKELILQPQADPEVVRRALRGLHLSIDREALVHEDGKYYPVMHAVHGRQLHPDWGGADLAAALACEDLFGPVLLSRRDEVLYRFLSWRKRVNGLILQSLTNAQNSGSEAVLQKEREVRQMLSLLELSLSLYS